MFGEDLHTYPSPDRQFDTSHPMFGEHWLVDIPGLWDKLHQCIQILPIPFTILLVQGRSHLLHLLLSLLTKLSLDRIGPLYTLYVSGYSLGRNFLLCPIYSIFPFFGVITHPHCLLFFITNHFLLNVLENTRREGRGACFYRHTFS